LAEPSFEERYDPSRRELILFSDLSITGRLSLPPTMPWPRNTANSQIGTPAERHTYIRISPPFARLKLNEALARREAVAREVTLTITAVKDGKTQPATGAAATSPQPYARTRRPGAHRSRQKVDDRITNRFPSTSIGQAK